MLLYDITSAASFEGAKKWLSELDSELSVSGSRAATVLIVVGSKADRSDERQVPIEDAREMASQANAEHLECSSKDGSNCEEVFAMVGKLLEERGLAHAQGSTSSSHGPLLSRHGDVVVRRVGQAGCCA